MKDRYTSRERVNKTINFIEPDKVPISFGSSVPDGINYQCYKELLDFNGIKAKIHYCHKRGELVIPDEEILEKFKVDTRGLYFNSPDRVVKEITLGDKKNEEYLEDEWHIVWRKVGYNYIDCINPFGHIENPSIGDLRNFSWPDPDDSKRFEKLEIKAKDLYEKTNYAVILNLPNGVIHMGQQLRGGDDIGTQNGPLLSVEMYRKFIKPSHKEMIEVIKKYSNAKVDFHSCGSVYEFIPDIIDNGTDILNPVQVTAKNMDTEKLKSEFGKDLVFHGGIDIQNVLAQGSFKDIEEEIKKRIRNLAPNGGFILSTTHNMKPDIHPKNINSMFYLANKYGKYPITF
jgi:uroporphyrinogen decarboxylase